MRKLVLGGLILLLLVGGLVAFAVSNLNSLVEANKDRLLAQAEQVLGRPLQIGDIDISLWGGIGARLQNVALADDPAFSLRHLCPRRRPANQAQAHAAPQTRA